MAIKRSVVSRASALPMAGFVSSMAVLIGLAIVPFGVAAATVSVVHSFAGEGGEAPTGRLVVGRDGALYGVTRDGGDSRRGTVYRLDPDGTHTRLHSFTGPDGRYPTGGLEPGVDGRFYGVTGQGGFQNRCAGSASGCGAIFSIGPDGQFVVLHALRAREGAAPSGPLVTGADGAFYGAAAYGGRYGHGSIFRITRQGEFSIVAAFSDRDGHNPSGQLLPLDAGGFYGTTRYGGAYGLGTLYHLSRSGKITTLVEFSGPDGAGPGAGLIRTEAGELIGTTWRGGKNDAGTVYRFDPESGVTVLHSFSGGTRGSYPSGLLVLAADGRLYGMTDTGGRSDDCKVGEKKGCGTIFSMTPDGEDFQMLHAFFPEDGDDGAIPDGPLMEAMPGSLLCVTSGGGASYRGAVIRFDLSDPPAATIVWLPARTDLGDVALASGGTQQDLGAIRFPPARSEQGAPLEYAVIAVEAEGAPLDADLCYAPPAAQDAPYFSCNAAIGLGPRTVLVRAMQGGSGVPVEQRFHFVVTAQGEP